MFKTASAVSVNLFNINACKLRVVGEVSECDSVAVVLLSRPDGWSEPLLGVLMSVVGKK